MRPSTLLPRTILILTVLSHRIMALPIHDACSSGNVEEVSQLLSADPALVHAQDALQMTPLHIAARDARTEIVRLLLSNGAAINAQGYAGYTPLHLAAINNRIMIVRELLALGANTNVVDSQAQTPLDIAVQANNLELAENLRAGKSSASQPGSSDPEVQRKCASARSERLAPWSRDVQEFVVSKDGRHIATVIARGTQRVVSVDGQEGPACNTIRRGVIALSNDGQHVAYPADIAGRHCLVIDGKPGPSHGGVWSVVLSRDGRHTAYAAEDADKWRVVLDGEDQPAYDGIGTIVLSHDGKRCAYGARRRGNWLAVIDGKEQFECDSVSSFVFSPDGTGVAYRATREQMWCVVLNGRLGRMYAAVDDSGPVFSWDGKRLGYAANSGERWRVVVNQREEGEYVGARAPVFAPSGTRAAYPVRLSSASLVVPLRDPKNPATMEWERAQRTGADKWAVVVDGRIGPTYDSVGLPIFSDDGRHVGYRARKGATQEIARVDADGGTSVAEEPIGPSAPQWMLVVDGREVGGYDQILDGSPVFSADGARVAFGARHRKSAFVVVDGREGSKYTIVGTPRFSADGQHVAYWAEGAGGAVVVLDGVEGPNFSAVLWGPTFRSDQEIEYIARDEDSVYRVTGEKQAGRVD